MNAQTCDNYQKQYPDYMKQLIYFQVSSNNRFTEKKHLKDIQKLIHSIISVGYSSYNGKITKLGPGSSWLQLLQFHQLSDHDLYGTGNLLCFLK